MIRLLSILGIAFLITDVIAAEPNTLTDAEKADGWKLLFDGKTTKGWVGIGKTEFPAKGWTVVDGALHHEKGGGGGDIVTAEHFENFELAWEWKIGAVGNSGLKYNLVDPNKAVGFEYQMIDDEQHPDGVRGGSLHHTAALYDIIAPSAEGKTNPVGVRKANPVGTWNQSRVVLRGNRLEHWVNGVKTVEVELGSESLKAAIAKSKFKTVPNFGVKTKSPILLQDHGDEVSVRNIKIRAQPGS